MLKIASATIALSVCAGGIHAQVMDHANMAHSAHMPAMAAMAAIAAIADEQRQAEVSGRGKDVMPFSLAATTHIFTKTAEGGVQQLVVKNPADAVQEKMIRRHLQELREQFLKGDYSGPSHIHGQDMPGLADLRAAKPGEIAIAYKDIAGGAQLTYNTPQATLVAALHKWFAAQVADHGKDAMEGHVSHGDAMKK